MRNDPEHPRGNMPPGRAVDDMTFNREVLGRFLDPRRSRLEKDGADPEALPPAVAGEVELWGFCDDAACPKEHIHEEGDCRRCRLPDDHPAVVRLAAERTGGV